MSEQDEFFSPNQLQLWKLAWWAKNLSLIVLIVYILAAGLQVVQFQNTANYSAALLNQPTKDFLSLLGDDLLKSFNLAVNIAATLLKGVVYYVVLKGVYLGLNMIVETDINYREQKEGEDE